MPLPLVEAVALHLTPASVTMSDFSLLTVVHVANVLAQEANARHNGIPLPRLDTEYLAALELPKKIDAWRKLLDSPPAAPVPQEQIVERPAPLPIEQEVKPPSAGKLLILVGLAAVVVAAMVLWKNAAASKLGAMLPKTTSGTNSVPAAVAIEPSLASSNGEKPAAAEGASPFDAIQVQAIIYSTGHPVALINGKSLNVGEHIKGLEVVSIERSKVTLSSDGQLRSFPLK
jgi:hypothetical protein